MHYDVFNGDADGLCSRHQLRLCEPCEATLVTGVKRDIALLARVPAGPGDSISVFDVSLGRNRDALDRLLERGVAIRYFDHHRAGATPAHSRLELHLDPAPDTCTGLIVDRYLGGRQRPWALVAAFGDGLVGPATALGLQCGYGPRELTVLAELGEALNFNAYGETEADLVVAPAMLSRMLSRHGDPIACRRDEPLVATLVDAMNEDLARARALPAVAGGHRAVVHVLPDAAWSRRVRGVFGNELARAAPGKAHAVLSPDGRGAFVVSVRSAPRAGIDAGAFCSHYAGGGGRATAGGIDRLAADEIERFVAEFVAACG